MPSTTFHFRLPRRDGFRSTAYSRSSVLGEEPASSKEKTEKADNKAAGSSRLNIGLRSQDVANSPDNATSRVATPPAAATPSRDLEQRASSSDDAAENSASPTVESTTANRADRDEKGDSADA